VILVTQVEFKENILQIYQISRISEVRNLKKTASLETSVEQFPISFLETVNEAILGFGCILNSKCEPD